MRIEDIFTQSVNTKNLRNHQKQVEDNAYAAAEPQDTVTISQAAAAARDSGVDLTRAAKEAQAQERQRQERKPDENASEPAAEMSPARKAFKAYMDEATGRNPPPPPKDPEEQMEELKEKIEKLQARLSNVMSSSNLPEQVKNSRSQSINSQIKAAEAQLAQVAKVVAERATAEAQGQAA